MRAVWQETLKWTCGHCPQSPSHINNVILFHSLFSCGEDENQGDQRGGWDLYRSLSCTSEEAPVLVGTALVLALFIGPV